MASVTRTAPATVLEQMISRNPQSSFEQLLNDNVSDEQLDEWESEYERDIAQKNVLLAAVRATKEARQAISGAAVKVRAKRPRTMIDAVLTIMTTEPDSAWTADEILGMLRSQDWEPKGQTPKNSVDATLSRMVSEGYVVRESRGVYRLLVSRGANAACDSA